MLDIRKPKSIGIRPSSDAGSGLLHGQAEPPSVIVSRGHLDRHARQGARVQRTDQRLLHALRSSRVARPPVADRERSRSARSGGPAPTVQDLRSARAFEYRLGRPALNGRLVGINIAPSSTQIAKSAEHPKQEPAQ